MIGTRITTGTIARELKEEFFEILKKQLKNPKMNFLERIKIEKILSENKNPIHRETIQRVAAYYGVRYSRGPVRHLYFTRPQAQLIKKAIREVYFLGI